MQVGMGCIVIEGSDLAGTALAGHMRVLAANVCRLLVEDTHCDFGNNIGASLKDLVRCWDDILVAR